MTHACVPPLLTREGLIVNGTYQMRGEGSPLRRRAIELCRRILEVYILVHSRLTRPAAHTVSKDLVSILQVFRRQLLQSGVAQQISGHAQVREDLREVGRVVSSAKEVLALKSAHNAAGHSSAETGDLNFQDANSALIPHVDVETSRLASLLRGMEVGANKASSICHFVLFSTCYVLVKCDNRTFC